jgi:hypothetical protein
MINSSATNRVITSKDHGSIQINIGHVTAVCPPGDHFLPIFHLPFHSFICYVDGYRPVSMMANSQPSLYAVSSARRVMVMLHYHGNTTQTLHCHSLTHSFTINNHSINQSLSSEPLLSKRHIYHMNANEVSKSYSTLGH